MPSGQVVVFDIWSSFGYFRRFYTTTTALTFNFIPRSAIEGLIGAMLGITSKDLNRLASAKIGLAILNEIHKIPFATMHTHSDFWDEMNLYLEGRPSRKKIYHARVNMELLVNPKYRIYFSDENLSEQLAHMIANHECTFTPYLGTSTMLSNFSYVGTLDYDTKKKDIVEISSVIPYRYRDKDKMPDVVIESGKLYAIEDNIPGRLDQNRDLLYSYSALYSPNAQTIKIRNAETNVFFHDGKEDSFVFLPCGSDGTDDRAGKK